MAVTVPIGALERPSCFSQEEWLHVLHTRAEGFLHVERCNSTFFRVRNFLEPNFTYCTAEELPSFALALSPDRVPGGIHYHLNLRPDSFTRDSLRDILSGI